MAKCKEDGCDKPAATANEWCVPHVIERLQAGLDVGPNVLVRSMKADGSDYGPGRFEGGRIVKDDDSGEVPR